MERIAIIGENSLSYIRILLDIWNEGNSAVLIDYMTPEDVCLKLMTEAEVKKCYIDDKIINKWSQDDCNRIEFVVFENDKENTFEVPVEAYERFHSNYSEQEAIVIYSSGTTGACKGIRLSHYAINTNADAIIEYMQPKMNDCMYIVKKLSHSSTLVGELLVCFKKKLRLFVSSTMLLPRMVLRNVDRYGVTIMGVNPTMLSLYCNECKMNDVELKMLEAIYVSGSILDDKTYFNAHDVFKNSKIYNVYGLSETGPRISAQSRTCSESNSVGKPISGVKVLVLDEFGNEVAVNTRGIIHVKTPSLFLGYISGNQKNKSLLQGYFNTGDVGFFDEHGDLHIVGRIDDLIIIDSHKIFPAEIEAIIKKNSNVSECVVEKYENKGKSFLVCMYIQESNEPLRISCLRELLLPHEIPKKFLRTSNFPQSSNGKIERYKIKELLKKG